uniref:G-protein coupled receptors family 1 profile domain-containing protein n=1 Tax=Ditylenchus dipsaci TaxID=166011 RepID=A0A915DVH2_9BILA
MDLASGNISTVPAVDVGEECFAKSEAYDEFRYALVVYLGSPIAVLGIISNAILIRLFCNKKRLKSPTFYLFALAIFDTLICAIYLPFFTVDAISIYYGQANLYKLWHSYAMVLYGTSRMVQFASTYMCMSFVGSTAGRFATVGLTLFTVFMLRLPAFFDYQIVHNEDCPDFQDFSFAPFLMASEDYIQFNFYIISFLHILLPFLLLLH